MVRAGEASGALAVIFARLAEFERSRDDLRNFIVSAMIYISPVWDCPHSQCHSR